MSYAQARSASRTFFPTWSRRMRAKWVLAKLRAGTPRVPISIAFPVNDNTFKFVRQIQWP